MTRSQHHRHRLDPDALRYAMRHSGFCEGGKLLVPELAFASGVRKETIETYLSGVASNPSASYLIQIAEALDVEPIDLMKPTEEAMND